MTVRKWAVRVVLFAGGVFLSLVLLTILVVQIQQRMLRWRAERLSADMQHIRLYQSTWADAQRLMRRWGSWGHYDGSCTPASCKYEIRIVSLGFYNPYAPPRPWIVSLLQHDRLNVYERLGGRGSGVFASFTVYDGTIWRTGTGIGVSVPTRRIRKQNEFEWTLFLSAGSYQRLHATLKDWGLYMHGPTPELGKHPYYKVGRPSGCIVLCQEGVVYYSTHTPPAEIERLTSYNFSCFTSFRPCAHIEDLLPESKEWHLYSKYESSPTVSIPATQHESGPFVPSTSSALQCNVPVWALARDTRYVLSIEVLSTAIEKHRDEFNQNDDRELAKVRVLSSLKEPAPWLPGAIANAYPFRGDAFDSPRWEAEHLVPGRRFIVFPIGNDRRDQRVTKDSPITLEWCGVQNDTPEVRRELEKGFAQNDALNP